MRDKIILERLKIDLALILMNRPDLIIRETQMIRSRDQRMVTHPLPVRVALKIAEFIIGTNIHLPVARLTNGTKPNMIRQGTHRPARAVIRQEPAIVTDIDLARMTLCYGPILVST